MHKLSIAVATTLLTASTAIAETVTHAIPYTYSMATDGDVYPRLTIPGFDNQSGQRILTRVDVRVQSQISATIAIENMTDSELSGWTLSAEHLVLTGLERENPTEFGPFAFLGGLSLEPFTGTLKPTDGAAGSGDDYLTHSDTTTIDSILDMDPSYHEFFNVGGEILAVVGPFTESFLEDAELYDPELNIGQATVQFTDLSQAGTFSVIYHYNVVPEPTSLAVLAGLVFTRRNRR